MQTEAIGSPELAVVAGDVLALRGAGLAAPETWALLCQAAQALQDLFLSNGGVVGGSGMGPVVTPQTLELTPRGRITLLLASPETARTYLPPEYRPGRVYSDTDSEKMWMYSLGRALLDTTPRITALTGSVSVSPSSALQSVLAAMTEPDPRRRASLMNLLDVISEYCRTRLQPKSFAHIIMDMYREVVRSSQYETRKRAAQLRSMPPRTQCLNQHQLQSHQLSQHRINHQSQQHQKLQQQHYTGHFLKHQAKGALFKTQSRNSRSHPNLHSLSRHEISLSTPKPQFQSQIDIQMGNVQQQQQPMIYHARTSSQPESSEKVHRELTDHTRSANNLLMFSNNQRTPQSSQTNVHNDPIYALPAKPFRSSHDVRTSRLSAKPSIDTEDCYGPTMTGRPRMIKNGAGSQLNPEHLVRPVNYSRLLEYTNENRVKNSIGKNSQTVNAQALHRQFSNPQLPIRNVKESAPELRHYTQCDGSAKPNGLRAFNGDDKIPGGQRNSSQTNLVSSMNVLSLYGPVPPKPPRVITTLKRSAGALSEPNNVLGESIGPAKPPRLAIKNGPRARRGKPVQRAPSRLYRAIGGPIRCFNKTQCVGPEFVVRANQPPKVLSVGDTKVSSSGRIVVILLTGQRIEVTCDPQKIIAGELFQAIVQAEGLDENFTLGLAALLAGDFAMLPPETKLNKVAPPGWLNSGKNKGTLGLPTGFMLYLRFRFFLPSLRGTRSWISKHLLYLQIRRCILEQQLVCSLAQLVNLMGLALQAEFGNYNVNEHGRGDYFLLDHYIPETLILNQDAQVSKSQPGASVEALRAYLHQAHRDRRGLDANNAEEMFITHAQALSDYGSHYYIATVDNDELEKLISRLKKSNANRSPPGKIDGGWVGNIFQLESSSDCPVLGKIDFNYINSCDNIPCTMYTDQQDIPKGVNANGNNYAVPLNPTDIKLVERGTKNNNSSSNNKHNKSKKSENNLWLAIHAQGLKLFERDGQPRDRTELARLQWRDIQTLSYSKNYLIVYTRFNGKHCKFKLRMDHKKSYYAFKLTSLHHQFFLKLRSELTSLQGLAKDFGIPLIVKQDSPPVKQKVDSSKAKITTVNSAKIVPSSKYPMQLEEYQNKQNENPPNIVNHAQKNDEMGTEPVCYTPEDNALYAQVNARLEPEGASRDTEDEFDRVLASRNGHVAEILEQQKTPEEDKLHNNPNYCLSHEKESLYSMPTRLSAIDIDRLNDEMKNPEALYAAIIKPGRNKKRVEYPVPDEVWDVTNPNRSLYKVKTSSLPNYGTPRQGTGFRTPSLPRRLGVKMGTRAIYSSVVQRDSNVTTDLESLSVKSDAASSIQSTSAHSNESPMPEAYVLNADIRMNDETFRIGNDDTMSASLVARLEELSFAEERILHTILLERGHGGSIGLQVTEGNGGGVYVQAVSVGGSADMAGNVKKGDRIVAINGQSLLNLRYDEALKMLQSSSETVELVLSQETSNRHGDLSQKHLTESTDNNYPQSLGFGISPNAEASSIVSKWLPQRAADVASVHNTSSAYSSAASSAMGNHNMNNTYLTDAADINAFNSASMLLSLEDLDPYRKTTMTSFGLKIEKTVNTGRRRTIVLDKKLRLVAKARSAKETDGKRVGPMDISGPPPVPPRRRKRKTDIVVPMKIKTATRPVESEHKLSALPKATSPERKLRTLRPPPPVPQSIVARENKSRSPAKESLPSKSLHNSGSSSMIIDTSGDNLHTTTAAQEFVDASTSPHFIITEVLNFEENASSTQTYFDNELCNESLEADLKYRNENRSGRSSPMPHSTSPVFCSLRQFEDIMAHSGQSDKSVNEQYDSIVTLEPSEPLSRTSVIDNSGIEDDETEDRLCFRVTTTNVPFETPLDNWTMSCDTEHVNDNFNDADDNYIFEDYMDRSKRLNRRPPGATFLFDEKSFQNFERDEPISIRSATKVRFVIDSPRSSPDPDLNSTFHSFHSVESMIDNDGNFERKSSVIITEINDECRSDEFGDVPFSSLIANEINITGDVNFHENNHSTLTSCLKKSKPVNNDQLKSMEESDSSKFRNEENLCERVSSPKSEVLRSNTPKKLRCDPISNVDKNPLSEQLVTYDPRDEGFISINSNANANLDLTHNAFADDKFNHSQTTYSTSNISENKKKSSTDLHENQMPISSILDDSEHEKSAAIKRKMDHNARIISALYNFIDDDDVNMIWKNSSKEDWNSGEPDSGGTEVLANLNDRRVMELGETEDSDQDRYPVREVSLSENATSHRSTTGNCEPSDQSDFNESQAISASNILSQPHCLDSSSSVAAGINDDTMRVPASVRRNSFLENMLSDDRSSSFEGSIPCSIIAIHPKPTSPRAMISSCTMNIMEQPMDEASSPLTDIGDIGATRQNKIIETGSKEKLQEQLGNETGAKLVGPKPIVRSSIGRGFEKQRTKNTGEAKSEMLSELLCNFSAIKLKSTEPHKREWDLGETDNPAAISSEVEDEETGGMIKAVKRIKAENKFGVEIMKGETKVNEALIESLDSRSSCDEKLATSKTKETMETKRLDAKRPASLHTLGSSIETSDDRDIYQRNSDKGALVVIECMADNMTLRRLESSVRAHNLDTLPNRVLDNRETIAGVDQCAIDRKKNDTQIRRNNNDNNNVTPVDLSNDQNSCNADISAIAPGSVRSFVQLYEIQRDQTSKHSKSAYSVPVAKASSTKLSKGSSHNTEDDATIMRETDEKMRNRADVQTRGEIKVGKTHGNKHTNPSVKVTNYDAIMVNANTQNGSDGRNESSCASNLSSGLQEALPGRGTPIAAKKQSQESCLKSPSDVSPRSEFKKTVTFHNCHRMVETDANNRCEIEFIDPTIADKGAKPKTSKRMAPKRPVKMEVTTDVNCASTEKSILPSGNINVTPSPRSDVSLIHPQTHQPGFEDDRKNGTIRSGIASTVPKSDVPKFRQPYVFYCRV